MVSSWAVRVRSGISAVVAIWSVISLAPAYAEVGTRPVAHDARDGRPFAVVDKRQATLSVYAADGQLVGRTSALLGLTPGDEEPVSARGKDPDALQRHERVTPAGRFEAVPGRNLSGDRVVWFNYDTNLAIHRLRPAAARDHRPERLVSANAEDHRITFGCVVVDSAFFDRVVLPTLGGGASLVYILPERDSRDARIAGAPGRPGAAASP